MNKEMIKNILDAAIKAPSGDNCQPWRFQVSEDFTRIKLFNLPEKDNSYYNFEQAASYIAHGAVLENILIAARHLGANAAYTLFPNASDPDLVASIDLTETTAQADPLYPEIFNRCTNRFPYRRIDIPEEGMKRLNDSVNPIADIKIRLVTQRNKINTLAKILMVNDRLVFENKKLHGFLFDQIRWNKKQVEETMDGMPVETLGLNAMEKPVFPLMRFWGFVKTSNLLGLSRIIGLKCLWNCRNASILGMVSITGNDKYAFVASGRAVQRLWLEATRQGLAVQPIIGLTLLINRLRRNNLQTFDTKHTQMVEQAEKSLTEFFNMAESETMVMGFRLGKGIPLSVMTMRKVFEL